MATATANLKLKKKTPTGIDAIVDGVFDHIPVRFPVAESSREAKWTSLCAFCFCFCCS